MKQLLTLPLNRQCFFIMFKLNKYNMKKAIIIFLFGEIKGEKVPEPKFKTTLPSKQPSFNEWANKLEVSSAYKR